MDKKFTVNKVEMDPYPADKMHEYMGNDTFCSVLQNVYFRTDNEDIKRQIRMAVKMGKNMILSLLDYRQMLLEHRIIHFRDTVTDWQTRRKNLYRGKNFRKSRYYEGKNSWEDK